MKIKNLLFVGIAAAALFAGCKKDEVTDASITLDPAALEIAQGGETKTITVTANRDWVVQKPDNASWVTVEPMSGSASDKPVTVTISAGANADGDRTAKITFSATVASKELTVTQPGALGGNPYQEFLDAEKGSEHTLEGQVVAISGVGIVINKDAGNVWVYCSKSGYQDPTNVKVGDMVSVKGTKDIMYDFPELVIESYDAITKVSDGTEVVYPANPFVVNADSFASLDQTECIYIKYEGPLSQDGNFYNVDIDGVSQRASLRNPASYLNIGNFVGKVVVVTGYQVISNGKYIHTVVTGIAESDSDYFSVSPLTASFLATGGVSNEISVSSNVEWTVTSSDPDNFSVSTASGNGNDTFTITATENTTSETREAEVTVSTTSADVAQSSYTIKVTQVAASATGEPQYLIISEYVEGSSNNKYLEIYNPTSETVDLSAYSIVLHQFSGSNAFSQDKTLQLSGTLAAGKTIVCAHNQAELYKGEIAFKDGNVIQFNGNDPIGLYYNGIEIDRFGPANEDITGDITNAKDHTLRRISSVKHPSATYVEAEWQVFEKDDVSDLGKHTVE